MPDAGEKFVQQVVALVMSVMRMLFGALMSLPFRFVCARPYRSDSGIRTRTLRRGVE